MDLLEENPLGVQQAEIVVGIPSLNEASSIAFPTQQADKGLTKYYPDRSAVIINCDNNSPDDTRQAFMQTSTKTPKMYLSTAEGVVGKGNNLRNLFRKAVELSAKAIIVLDADLRSVSPLWIRHLIEPLFDNYQFVAPLYVRHKYDGTVTNNIAYPMTRALYGRRVRQPIGGDIGFSAELAHLYLEADSWDERVSQFGVTIWMTTLAMRSRASVIQSFMGKAKVHTVKDLSAQLASMFEDVVGTMFQLMRHFDNFWKEVKWSRPSAVFGFGVGGVEMPPPVEVDTRSLWEHFISGLKTYWDLYGQILHTHNVNKLEEVAGLPEEAFEFPTSIWAKILYDFAVAYKNRITSEESLLAALIPLYYAKTLSFVLDTQPMNTQQVEEYIEDQCLQFEKTKPYLLERWFSE